MIHHMMEDILFSFVDVINCCQPGLVENPSRFIHSFLHANQLNCIGSCYTNVTQISQETVTAVFS